MTAADIILDEFVQRLEPMPWFRPQIPSLTQQRQCELVFRLVERGLLRRVGVARYASSEDQRRGDRAEVDVLYGVTEEGHAYWEKNVKGRRRQSAATATFPRYRESQMVAACNPCDVFDLARAPWRHKLTRDLE